jgi:DNA-binding beta-propeller fold protein YncE
VSSTRRPSRWLPAALVLAAATAAPAAPPAPVYVRGLELPVADDAIGYPQGVTADLHTGEVFVCDARMNRILVFDAQGLFVYEMPGGDAFAAPQDVAVDPEGRLVVVASRERRSAVVELDFDGLFLREVRLSGLPEGLEELRFGSVALSPTGDRLYLLDTSNLRVWICSRAGEVKGSIDLAAGLAARATRDLIPGHVDVYGDTLLVAVPSFSQIRLFDLDGTPRRQTGVKGTAACTLGFPTAAALAKDGELVIVDQQRMMIVRWNAEANRCLGEYIGYGNLPGYLYYPIDLALDGSGQIFVSQGFEGRVQMFSGMTPAPASTPAR